MIKTSKTEISITQQGQGDVGLVRYYFLCIFHSFSKNLPADYTHYMHAVMNCYIKKFFKANDEDKRLWIDLYKSLYFCTNHEDMEVLLYEMFVFGIAKKESAMSK